jgi:hypothetical protein
MRGKAYWETALVLVFLHGGDGALYRLEFPHGETPEGGKSRL